MRRALVCTTLAVLSSMSMAASGAQPPDSSRPVEGVAVTMRGCVSGSLLKDALVDQEAGAGPLAPGDRYRMIGTKQIRAQIKKANKTLARITGRIKPGPQAVVKGTKMGGTTIGIGVAPGTAGVDPQAPYTPTIEVDAIEILAKTCDG